MITVQIDETIPTGRRILKEISNNPHTGRFDIPGLPRDINGNISGMSFDEAKQCIKNKFKEVYGIDYDEI